MTNKYFSVIKEVIKARTRKGFDRNFNQCQLIDVKEGNVLLEMKVSEEHLNWNGTLHGGLIASLADITTSLALLATKQGISGVSVDLTTSYLCAAKLGETILIDASVLRSGKNLAYTQAKMWRKSDNKLLAIAQHTKFCVPKYQAKILE